MAESLAGVAPVELGSGGGGYAPRGDYPERAIEAKTKIVKGKNNNERSGIEVVLRIDGHDSPDLEVKYEQHIGKTAFLTFATEKLSREEKNGVSEAGRVASYLRAFGLTDQQIAQGLPDEQICALITDRIVWTTRDVEAQMTYEGEGTERKLVEKRDDEGKQLYRNTIRDLYPVDEQTGGPKKFGRVSKMKPPAPSGFAPANGQPSSPPPAAPAQQQFQQQGFAPTAPQNMPQQPPGGWVPPAGPPPNWAPPQGVQPPQFTPPGPGEQPPARGRRGKQ